MHLIGRERLSSTLAGLRDGQVRVRLPDGHTLKVVLAAVIAYLVAGLLTSGGSTLLAPLTALLVSQVTVFETLTSGLRRVVAVVIGVLLAIAFADFVVLSWWSLGLLLVVAYFIGAVLALGDYSTEVSISAMLVFAVGGAHTTASGRVVETLVGAAVGICFNFLVMSPRVAPAGVALVSLAERISGVLAGGAQQLRAGWSAEAARVLLAEARRLGRDVERAEDAFAAAERSLRLNPRANRFKATAPSLRAALAAMEHSALSVRELGRVLSDLSEGEGMRAAERTAVRDRLADVLDELSAVTRAFGHLAVGDVAGATGGDGDLRGALERAHEHRGRLAEVLAVDAWQQARLWTLHGALLQAVDRVLQELDLDAGPDARRVPRPARPPSAARAAGTKAATRTRGALGRAAIAARTASGAPESAAARAAGSRRSARSRRPRAALTAPRLLLDPTRRRVRPEPNRSD